MEKKNPPVADSSLVVLQGRSERRHSVDGEVCGEEHSPAAQAEGHHLKHG